MEQIKKVLSNVSQGLSNEEQAQARANIGLGALATKDTAAYGDLSSGVRSSLDKADSAVQDANYVHTDNNFTTADKDKLAGIASGAQVNVIETVKRNGVALAVSDKAVDVSVPVPSDTAPSMDGAAAAGSSADYSRRDHVHPTDTTRQAVANMDSSIPSTVTSGHYPSTDAVKSFVNSSVATATANFLGTFTLADLGVTYDSDPAVLNPAISAALGSRTWTTAPTNNDYVYIDVKNPATPSIDDEYRRFKFNGTSWLYEYTLNNSSFTTAEMDAIDSGITASLNSAYNTHVNDVTSNPHNVTKAQVGLGNVTDGAAVANVGWDSSNGKITKTIGSSTTDVVSAGTLKSAMSLNNVDNTSDATKKTNFTGSIASGNTGFVTGGDAYTALNGKVDKVTGKGLSENDFTTTLKNKLDGIAAGAEVNQNAFSYVKVGSTTISARVKKDTLELVAGNGIFLTPDATNDKVTIDASGNTFIGVYGSTPYNMWFSEYAKGKQLVCQVGPVLNGYSFYYLDMLGQQGTDPITFSRIVSNANVTNGTQHISTVVCNTDNTYAIIGNDVSGTSGTYTNLTVGMAKSVGNTSGNDAVALTTAGLGITNGTKTISAGNGVVSASDGFVGDLTGNAATATKATVLQDNTISNQTVGATTSVQGSASNYLAMWVNNVIVPVHTNNFTAYAAHRDAAGNGIAATYQRKDAIGVGNTTWTRTDEYLFPSSGTVQTSIAVGLVSSGTVAAVNLIVNNTESGTTSGGSNVPGSVILTVMLRDDNTSTIYDQQVFYTAQSQTLCIPLVAYYSGSSNHNMHVCVKIETANGYWKGGITGKVLYINR